MTLHRLLSSILAATFLSGLFCAAQETAAPPGRTFVNFVSASSVVVSPGKSTPVQFTFRIVSPYHINSNKPLAEELIPTQIHFSLPGEVALGRITYPVGKLTSFPFDPGTKLSVYSGDVVIRGIVVAPLAAATGTYTIHGELKYQACDNNACYPPKKLPFTFNVRVGARARHKVAPRLVKTSSIATFGNLTIVQILTPLTSCISGSCRISSRTSSGAGESTCTTAMASACSPLRPRAKLPMFTL
jgi:cytochrome c biogenesis DsbD-like protein